MYSFLASLPRRAKGTWNRPLAPAPKGWVVQAVLPPTPPLSPPRHFPDHVECSLHGREGYHSMDSTH